MTQHMQKTRRNGLKRKKILRTSTTLSGLISQARSFLRVKAATAFSAS